MIIPAKRSAFPLLLLLALSLATIYVFSRPSRNATLEQSLHQQLLSDGSVNALAAVADQTFSTGKILQDSVVKDLRTRGLREIVEIGGPKGLEGVYFVYGGGADSWYGVLVMRAGIVPPYAESHLKKWSSNVWYYSEERL